MSPKGDPAMAAQTADLPLLYWPQGESPLIKNVNAARTVEQLGDIHQKLCRTLLAPIQNGISPEAITHLITSFSDAVIDKIMALALNETGPPPCPFVFMTMGSEGRQEQTLISDQDNAIIFEDMADNARAQEAKVFFDHLAQTVCAGLDRAGYRFCEGNNMAQNPKWCQPLSVWKGYFHEWIHAAEPEDLLHSSIFFDFRGTFGQLSLADQLKSFLFKSIKGWAGFLRHMAENALCFRPPLGLFNKFLVETEKGPHKNCIDIKYALLPIVDYARVYALKHSIPETNTLGRLHQLHTKNILTPKEHVHIVQAYNFLMGLRFKRQATALMAREKEPDNFVNPGSLSKFDRLMLREVLKMARKMQQKLGIEFIGVV